MHYLISLSTGKNKSANKRLYVNCENIVEALNISKKIKHSQLNYIVPINFEEYSFGVSLKYDTKD